MKIGLIRYRYTPYGGAEVFLERFIKELLRRGHEIEVFSTSWAGAGVTLHRIAVAGPSFIRPLVFALRAAKEVERVKPDVVVSLERTSCQDIYRAGDGCHREWLIRRRSTASKARRLAIRLNPLHATLLYLEKRLFSSARLKKVVANSNSVKQDIIRHYGLPEEKICVIYNGIDAIPGLDETERQRIRRGFGFGREAVVLMFVGSGFERKGLIYLIRALGELKDRGDLRLLVIGKGKKDRYLREAQRLGVGERVVFAGPVKGASVLYRAGDIFVLPSIYEPFSNACLEAMAAGLPVVTSKVNGASEVMRDGATGAIVEDPTDSSGLARKIALFLDRDRRVEAGRAARIEARKYPIERCVNEFLKLVEDLGAQAHIKP
ncbi:MAG: glycosyltransferase family 4 protein [Deltaproteobacteria bacterium]|nr:glycosyltransferase family 4 protein [Deltaproteobacteria bacterium]